MSKVRTLFLGRLVACAAVTCSLSVGVRAADISMIGADALGQTSFNTGLNWAGGAPPTAGNNYFVGDGTRLRTPIDGASYTFAGDSLTINNTTPYSEGLLYKGTGTAGVITINNLILDGGLISHAQGTGDLFQLDGAITVNSPSRLYAKQGTIDILSDISGTGDLSILATDTPANNAIQRLRLLGNNNGYSGNISVLGKLELGATGSLTFDIGPSGINNSITGTGFAEYNGVFNFDLTGASSNPGDSWTISSVATQNVGATFSVGGGFAQSGSFWTFGSYLFNPATGVLSVSSPPAEWNADIDDGLFSTGANWTSGSAPPVGGDALFGTVITANRRVLLNNNVSLNSITFNNAGDGDYYLAPQTLSPGTEQVLTLTGEAKVETASGRHWLQMGIAGTSGLQKTGAGELILDHANTFTGDVTVAAGRLSLTNPGAIPSGRNINLVAAGSNVLFGGPTGFFVDNGATGGGYVGGTINGVISGAGSVIVDLGATVTFTGANTYAGVTTVQSVAGTRLTLSGAGSLGVADGTEATHTRIAANGQVALVGKAVGNELLFLNERADAGTPVHLTSSGTSSWAGNIKGSTDEAGSYYKIESTAGTLTLSGIISSFDGAAPNDRNFVFGGAGDIVLAGAITDFATDNLGVPLITPANVGDNVNVIKRGAGTMTIATASASSIDYHTGFTRVEQGTLRVQGDGASTGELLSKNIDVRQGANLTLANFTSYSQQIGQTLGGSGAINTGGATLALFGDGNLAPGSGGVGTLTINGTTTLNRSGAAGGVLSYDLGAATTVGGAVNDLIQVNGSFTASGTDAMTVRVTPAAGTLAAGAYRLINHTSGGTADVTGMGVEVVNNLGAVLNPRQTFAVTSASGQVNLQVTGASSSLTWAGTVGNNTWDVANSVNWSAGNSFRDLDNVTFGAGGEKSVVLGTNVTPGSTTFNSASTYTFTGAGGIAGSGAVNVNAGIVKFQNTGNNYTGVTTVASGATLEAGGSTTGRMVVNGRLAVGGAGLVPGMTGSNFTYVDATEGGNTTLADGSPFVSGANPTNWLARAFGNTGGTAGGGIIYQADGDTAGMDAPALRTTLSGLTPNTAYIVHANYWDADGGEQWRIQAGSSLGTLQAFDSPLDAVPGAIDGVAVSSLTYAGTPPLGVEGNRIMYGGSIGVLMSDGSGQIQVFVDDLPTGGADRSWYDGLSYTSTLASGTVTGAQTLTVNGDMNLSASGVLALDIGQSGYSDLAAISGNLAAAGTLEVTLGPGLAPLAAGATYDLLNFASTSGAFATIDLPSLAGNLAWDTSQLLVSGVISVVSAGTPGDYNNDGFVDAADYTLWRDNLGLSDAALNGNGTGDASGLVVQADYTLWRNNFGNPASGALGAAGAVPEPSSVCLMLGLIGTGALALRRRSA